MNSTLFPNAQNVHCLISYSSTDEIRDMPANYGYQTSYHVIGSLYLPQPVCALQISPYNGEMYEYIISGSWSALLDGSIDFPLYGAGIFSDTFNDPRQWYSGSYYNGAVHPSNCNSWLSTSGYYGQVGQNDMTHEYWISRYASGCGNSGIFYMGLAQQQ